MVTRGITESARHQAQDLAYKAMSARDPEETLRLCTKALEIDPRCVDALVIMAGEFGTDERIAHLARVVKIAEEDLGGNSYFDENRGHFWGLLETRPYGSECLFRHLLICPNECVIPCRFATTACQPELDPAPSIFHEPVW